MEKFTDLKKIVKKINESDMSGWISNPVPTGQDLKAPIEDTPKIEVESKSEPCKFVSKIFESRQMAHVYHLQCQGAGAYSMHVALDFYYNEILELIDEFIEVYQGQYDIIGEYEVIETGDKPEEAVQYFIELSEFIKSTRKIAFVPEDTHLQNIIDEMVSLIYKTIYKLKNLK